MINEQRFKQNFNAISKFGALENYLQNGKLVGGLTRLAFSPEDAKAREFFIDLAKSYGLDVRVDSVGNIYAKFSDVLEPNLPAISVGSHIDSVPNGGFYDGTLGVMAGLEAIVSIKEKSKSKKLKRPLELIVFVAEESSRFKMATIGSKIVAGKLSISRLKELVDDSGISAYDAMKNFGLMPENLDKAVLKKGTYKSYLELHIEQGRVLEEMGISVGIVTGIAAPVRFELTINARADHSGATPMSMRSDALVAASHIVLAANSFASKFKTAVATVGYVRVIPGALNVIPGKVVMGVDMRDIDKECLNLLNQNLRTFIENLSTKLGFSYEIRELGADIPVKLDDSLVNLLCKNALDLGIKTHKMPSGAGHDAMHMSGVADNVGMIFIPCKGGISHNVNEDINFKDAINGANLLAKTMMDLANS